ncbi:anion permease [Peptoniphilus equinus]|uniref:Sodium-dependent dicarboxylate transporter SdcS n=1 Tax=Peptoniphilus equinus TaxID=3016343 RepID=A0ABY7QTG8_9FIRM|nr:anion permease [Peptoniphilus equinus]WBW49379.1 anion permease [Peptoniphilus equinus]
MTMKQDKSMGRFVTILIALVLMFAGRYVPAFPGLSPSGMQVLGIFAGVLILWLTVSIDWPSILLIGALAFVPELNFASILAGAYGGSTFVFLIFTFVVTYSLSQTTYIKRTAVAFISSSIASRGPWIFVTLYFASILFIGSFISPTVLFFVYLPILEEIYALLELEKGHKFAGMLMMGTVIMCGISSGMTPIAHVFPILAMSTYSEMYGRAINYGPYMASAIPVGLISAGLVILTFKYLLKPDTSAFAKFDAARITGVRGKTTRAEKIVLWVFILVVALWVLPSLITPVITTGLIFNVVTKIDALGTAFPPLLGLVILCILTDKGKPILNFSEAMSKGVSWSSVIMCAGTTALGSAITNGDIGVTAWISDRLAPLTANLPVIVMVLVFTLWAAVQTNLSSNMVTATVVSAAALTVTANIEGVNVASLIVNIGMMAAYAFATPPAMPCVAIAGSSGWTTTTQMMIYGFIAMFISVVIATFVGYPIGAMLL